MNFREPKEIDVNGKQYTISKFPAIAGREIVACYISSAVPKVGEYRTNEEMMRKLMGYVGVKINDVIIPLNTAELIDNHVSNWESLIKIEAAMMEYNCDFFQSGRLSTFLNDVAQNIPRWILKTLTDLSGQLSQAEKLPSES